MYAKMKKIFYLDASHGQGNLSSSSSEEEDNCFVNADKKKSHKIDSNRGLESVAKNGHTISDGSDNDLTLVESDVKSSTGTFYTYITNFCINLDPNLTSSTLDVIPSEYGDQDSASNNSSLPKNRTVISISENDEDKDSTNEGTSNVNQSVVGIFFYNKTSFFSNET